MPRFEVARADGKRAGPFELASPHGFPIEGVPGTELMRELAWYLEKFLDWPFPPETERAERVRAALHRWGTQAFAALFHERDPAVWLSHARARGDASMLLQVSSADARVLSWPWEALRDDKLGPLAPACQIERRLDIDLEPAPLGELPKERVNILLVTARPYEGDVRFRSISRPLLDLIQQHALPASVHLLRPPTWTELENHLRSRPRHYHRGP